MTRQRLLGSWKSGRHSTLVAAIAFLIGASTPSPSLGATTVTELFHGVRRVHRVQSSPRPLQINLLEIDPTADGISFLMTPENGSSTRENRRQTATSFLSSTGTQVAINASFYFESTGSYSNNRGVVASEGNVYSAFEADGRPWPTLNISADNVAQIVDRLSTSVSTEVTPDIPLFNAVSGTERIVTGGVNTAGSVTYGQPRSLHPRTLAGVKADGTVVLAVIDGRQSGYSEGVTSLEAADLLIGYGVVDAINLDGGGSSTMAIESRFNPVLNSPSDGSQRSVATHLGVFANPSTTPQNTYYFVDFFDGEEATFTLDPAYSGSSTGLLASSTATAVADPTAPHMGWAQELRIVDDPAEGGPTDNPDSSWFVRHLSGAWASPRDNVARDATGYVGFWAKTTTPGLQVSLAVDDNTETERGLLQDMVPDGEWRLYQWDLEDTAQWEGWVSGDGAIGEPRFSIDSIQIYGGDGDATVWIDALAHNAYGALGPIAVPEPASLLALATALAATPLGRPRRNR